MKITEETRAAYGSPEQQQAVAGKALEFVERGEEVYA
jgi:hypothetical protein